MAILSLKYMGAMLFVLLFAAISPVIFTGHPSVDAQDELVDQWKAKQYMFLEISKRRVDTLVMTTIRENQK